MSVRSTVSDYSVQHNLQLKYELITNIYYYRFFLLFCSKIDRGSLNCLFFNQFRDASKQSAPKLLGT